MKSTRWLELDCPGSLYCTDAVPVWPAETSPPEYVHDQVVEPASMPVQSGVCVASPSWTVGKVSEELVGFTPWKWTPVEGRVVSTVKRKPGSSATTVKVACCVTGSESGTVNVTVRMPVSS